MSVAGVLLVVVEGGATLPPWLASCQGKVSDTIVLVSAPDEQANHFAARAVQRLNALGTSDQRIQVAVLVPSDQVVGADVIATRLNITQAILAEMSRHNRGRLLLVTGRNLNPEAQIELLKLAGVLSERLQRTKLTVSLHFGAASEADPPHELLDVSPASQRRSSRNPTSLASTSAKSLPAAEKELPSAIVQTADSSDDSIESAG
jgi:hypothetical protein